MKNISKSNVITAIICSVALSSASFYTGTAASNSVSYQSQGKIVFNNNTEDTTDDVVFDASDFKVIDDMVVSGKKQIANELNKYPAINIDITGSIPDFSELANAVDILTDDTTDTTSDKILKGYTAYVRGSKIEGTAIEESHEEMTRTFPQTEMTTADITIEAGKGITIPANQYLTDALNISAENSSTIIDAVNNRGGNLSSDATNTEIANAIKALDLTVLGNVVYEYHHHSSNCYGTCGGGLSFSHKNRHDSGDYWNVYVCSVCKNSIEVYDMAEQPSYCSVQRCMCGYSEGQIISATITY